MGVVLTAVTVWHAATFNPEKTVTLTADSTQDSTFIYTSAGVLNIVTNEPRVTLTADQTDAVIEWGYGSSKDVAEYAGASSARNVKGFAESNRGTFTPAIEDRRADPKVSEADKKTISAGGFHLSASDQWEEAGSAQGSVDFNLEVEPGVDRSLIATTSAGKAPQLTLSWTRTELMASPAPFIAMGVLLALIGAVLLLTAWRDQMKREALARKEAQTKARREEQATALTTELPAYHGDLAAASTERAVQYAHTDGALGAGILPGTSRTLGIRASELKEEDRLVIAQQRAEVTGSADTPADSRSKASPRTAEAESEASSSDAAAQHEQDSLADVARAHAHSVSDGSEGEQSSDGEAENVTLWTYTEPFENEDEDELIDDTPSGERGRNA